MSNTKNDTETILRSDEMKRTFISIMLLMILGVGIIGASAYKSLYYDEKQEVTQSINQSITI